MNQIKLAVIALGTSLLWGCANIQQAETQPEPAAPEEADTEVVVSEGGEDSPAETFSPPAREFPIETFYSLLVAEIAGSRGRYDIELGNYIQEAHRTRDPAVTARAARIARYLNAHQAALSTAQLWVELEPDNPEALYIAAVELAQDGQLLDAFEHSEKLLDLGSTPIFHSIAARAAQATDTQRESLMADFDRLLDSHPQEQQLRVGRALLLQQEGELEEALDQVRGALDSEEGDVAAAVLEAQLLYQLKRPQEALTKLLTLLEREPDNRRLRLQYARMLAGIDLQEAQEQFEILVQQSPDDPELILSLALVANELGNGDLARDSFMKLITMGEQTDSAHYHLGQMEAKAGNLDAAVRHFRSVQQGPEFLPAVNHTLDILIGRGDLDAAEQQMRELRRRLSGENQQFYLLEAQALARHGHLDQAEALLTEALALHPASTELLYSRAMINVERNQIDLMEQDLRTVLKYQPNNAAALNALGYTLADRTNRYEEAYKLVRQALSIEPDDPAIIDSMGWVQYRLGNYDEALLRLREAMKVFPDHEVAAHLGEVLWVVGEREEARATWARGLELNPDSELIRKAMRRLEAEI
ncbi:tetratricopeptide repeat protein [Gilvimarinus sp. F26214L]|uniref:tetratricopeptide repeat protein n=1 Tax=Gilvimarinus sp. DZF01 TaxID=3461371 RepID=UPI0040465177